MLKENGTYRWLRERALKDCAYLSSCAKRDLWQSPKSRPQIFTFLSAEPVAIRAPSYGEEKATPFDLLTLCELDKEKLTRTCNPVLSKTLSAKKGRPALHPDDAHRRVYLQTY